MLCPIFVCTFLATPQITGTNSMQTCTEKGTDDIGKDAMLVYTVSNMYFYTWLQHIYMFMFETVLLCSLWFPSISVPSWNQHIFHNKTIEKRVPHRHTSIHWHPCPTFLPWQEPVLGPLERYLLRGHRVPETIHPHVSRQHCQWSHASVRHGFWPWRKTSNSFSERQTWCCFLSCGAILRWLVPKRSECDITRENPLWIVWFQDLNWCWFHVGWFKGLFLGEKNNRLSKRRENVALCETWILKIIGFIIPEMVNSS